MTAADLLRRAAGKLRATAQAATSGPWAIDGDIQAVRAASGTTIAYDDETEMADGRYLALMHPPVALALADLLDDEAALEDSGMQLSRTATAARALARAILREPEEADRG